MKLNGKFFYWLNLSLSYKKYLIYSYEYCINNKQIISRLDSNTSYFRCLCRKRYKSKVLFLKKYINEVIENNAIPSGKLCFFLNK